LKAGEKSGEIESGAAPLPEVPEDGHRPDAQGRLDAGLSVILISLSSC
jgi:hypothetical protein